MKPIYECGDNLNVGMLCLQQTHSNSFLPIMMYKEYFEKYRLSKDNFDNVEYELCH